MNTKVIPAALVALAVLSAGQTVVAQPSAELGALRKEIETLKEGQKAIQQDLQEIKNLLRAAQTTQAPPQAAPQEVLLSLDGAPFKGEKTAKVTMVEFSDYQCPFCARYFRDTLPQIEREYIRTGKVKYVLRDLPIQSIHPLAFKAAEATHCASEQGKYWEMHDRLFANPGALARKDLSGHAQALGLDVAAFDQCLDSGKHAARIRKDLAESQKAGVRGTPTFFLGLTEPNSSQLKAVRVIRGAQPYDAIKEAVDSLLTSSQ